MSDVIPNRRVLSDGEVLFQEGDSADCAYIVERGTLEISTTSEGSRVVLCRLDEGTIVGEMGVIDRAPRTATARAIGDTTLIMVTRDALTDRIAQADPVVKLLVKILLDRYRSGLNTVKGEQRMDLEHDLLSTEVVGEYVRHGIDKIRLEAELKDALNNEQLQVCYQPLLDVATEKIAGFEALTRWQHPDRGAISPGLFISLAEETNLIVPVGLYVFEQACRDLVVLDDMARKQGYPFPLFMSINVSGRQIADPQFISRAAEITDRCAVDRGRIKLEITESLAIAFELTQRWINDAQRLGFKISLDDFGTGYSSLETLAALPLDAAKVDQAFVRNLRGAYRDRELLRGIVSLMKGLGLEVIVEGIESRYELNFIAALDCHLAQGYLIGKALPRDQVEQLIIDGPTLD